MSDQICEIVIGAERVLYLVDMHGGIPVIAKNTGVKLNVNKIDKANLLLRVAIQSDDDTARTRFHDRLIELADYRNCEVQFYHCEPTATFRERLVETASSLVSDES